MLSIYSLSRPMRRRVALIAFFYLTLLTIYPKDMIQDLLNCLKDQEPLR